MPRKNKSPVGAGDLFETGKCDYARFAVFFAAFFFGAAFFATFFVAFFATFFTAFFFAAINIFLLCKSESINKCYL